MIWLLFRMPGAILLWIQYFFPSSGRVLVGARQRGNPIMEVIISWGFWLLLAITAVVKFGN
jgi:hypothetical protein